MDKIFNKVANSSIITINLEDFYVVGERVVFDIKPFLFKELILKEKDFRDFVKTYDWSFFKNKFVGIICSSDAIVPTWAYMLISIALEPFAKQTFFGNLNEIETFLFLETLSKINVSLYKDARVVIKGCGDKKIPFNAFVQLTSLLKPVVKSIMYGEPCSTVPLYKAKSIS